MFNKHMNNLRGIAIFLVIIGHSIFKDIITLEGLKSVNHLVWLYDFIYTFHMPLFFFISGFFAKKLFQVYDIKSYNQFLKSKLITIGIPYITFSIAGTIVKLLMSKLAKSPVGNSFIIDILFRPWDNPIKLLWFIYTLLIIFAILPLFNKIDIKIKLAVTGILWCLPLKYGEILNFDGVIRYSFFVLLGYAFYTKYNEYLNKDKRVIRPIILLCTLVLINIKPISQGAFQGIFEMICSLLAIVSLVDLTHILNCDSIIGKIFGVLGKYSMDIYLLHWFLQMPVRLIYQKLHFNYNILFIVAFIVAFISILISKYIIRKSNILRLIAFGKTFNNKNKDIVINN